MSARILVVDDDPWILRMVTSTLKKRGFTVDTARDGRQALDRVAGNAPDVIISDVMMPVMDGWTFVKQLRQDPKAAAIPVIFLTALGKDSAKLRSLGLTDDDFLAKPFRFDDLERRVDNALASRRPAASPPPAPGYPPTPNSGVHAMPGPTTTSGAHAMPPGPNPPSGAHPPPGYPAAGPNPNSGVHPMPGYPAPPNPNSGVHPMPTAPYPYPPGQYPAQYPPQYGQYPGQYPPPPPGQYPGQYPPQYGQYPGQYPPPGPGAQQPPQPPGGATPPPPPQSGGRVRRHTGLHGKIEQLGLSSLLVMLEMERKQGVLSIQHMESDTLGRVYIRGGRVVSASLSTEPDTPQRECVYRMLAWKTGIFSFSATAAVDMEDTVQSSTTHLLMEGARRIDETGRDEEGL